MADFYYDFEKPLMELETKLRELKDLANQTHMSADDEIKKMETKLIKARQEIFSKLSRWQRYQLAKHPQRPQTKDYIEMMIDDWFELHGDRGFRDDPSIMAGIGTLNGIPVAIIGQQKGRKTQEKVTRNFGMTDPEGFRKALRIGQMASRYGRPIITFVDTPGANPGIGAEERGISEAIARNLREFAVFQVPIIVVIIGEGFSGGALGIAVGDRILMLENAVYTVISPEGCAAIIWRDSSQGPKAAEALKIAANDCMELKVIDQIIKEPAGGAHRNHEEMGALLKEALIKHLNELSAMEPSQLIENRIVKFRQIGVYTEAPLNISS